ncbi:cell wall hydrolase [Sphingomonas sp. TZW2008]|uniref:cell wall hydrolase n=1 Tax=Sphingomonas sp. TZW2008 TaxID=1917973 RepID=UPI000A26ADD6|nr:cell wall hydrolase [Sphingomonas sp. TZW2008]
MAFFSQAAIAVAMTMTFLGLGAQSAPSMAAEVEQTTLPQPVTTGIVTTATTADAVNDELATGDTVAYPTLAAAVAAQTTHDGDDQATECLAGAIFYEAKGEPLSGQLAVADVILNRAKSGRFPEDVCQVVTQRGQFSFVRGGRIPSIDEDNRYYRTAVAVAKVALANAWEGEADRALYFNRGRAPAAGLRKVASIGNHVFWR